jgi:hypothetical protein
VAAEEEVARPAAVPGVEVVAVVVGELAVVAGSVEEQAQASASAWASGRASSASSRDGSQAAPAQVSQTLAAGRSPSR